MFKPAVRGRSLKVQSGLEGSVAAMDVNETGSGRLDDPELVNTVKMGTMSECWLLSGTDLFLIHLTQLWKIRGFSSPGCQCRCRRVGFLMCQLCGRR
jgi:hypothetical protein